MCNEPGCHLNEKKWRLSCCDIVLENVFTIYYQFCFHSSLSNNHSFSGGCAKLESALVILNTTCYLHFFYSFWASNFWLNVIGWIRPARPSTIAMLISLSLSLGLWDFKHCCANWEDCGCPSKGGDHWNRRLCHWCLWSSQVLFYRRRRGQGQ